MRTGVLVVCAAVALAGCGHKKHARLRPPPAARRAPSPSPPPPVPKPGDTENGLASWYGHPYHGRQAANGEIYDMETLVAAHRTLPFDTWVRVVNLINNKAVEVRIIDRGPFIEGRIIDLSHAAAREIELIGPGVARVRVEVLRTPERATAASFAVQVGAFRDRNNAERVRAAMAARYGPARLVQRQGDPPMWRVLVGSVASEGEATVLSDRIRQETGERNAFVVRLDS